MANIIGYQCKMCNKFITNIFYDDNNFKYHKIYHKNIKLGCQNCDYDDMDYVETLCGPLEDIK